MKAYFVINYLFSLILVFNNCVKCLILKGSFSGDQVKRKKKSSNRKKNHVIQNRHNPTALYSI